MDLSHDHRSGFANLEQERDLRIPVAAIRGQVPTAVRGTFLRIGPGRNRLGDQTFGHWFDGDGMVHALTFDDGGARYRNRFVRTPKYLAETAAGRIRKRGFGHNAPGGPLANLGRPPANAANTSVVRHGNRLLAQWEGGRPWALDPDDLSTLGEAGFGGGLRPFEPFSAHGHHHPESGCYYNHGVSLGRRGARVNLYRIGADGRMAGRGHFPLPRLSFLHGSAMSQRYWLFLEQPVAITGISRLLLGLRTLNDCLTHNPAWGMRAHVVDLHTLKTVRVFELDPFVVFHFGNAREIGDELFVELVRFKDFSINQGLTHFTDHVQEEAGEPVQLRLNLRTGGHRLEPLPHTAGCEFPIFDQRYQGRAGRFLYTAALADGGGFFNALQRQNTETGHTALHRLGAGRYISEPAFVPEGEREGDGYLCAAVYDARVHRSEIVLFDARDDDLTEVAAVPLPHHIPHGFHGGWDPA